MKVPLSVISGKSPMKTVWLLISPVSLFMNSAVTNSGAAYVKSRSLHSSTVFFGGSKRWSRNESSWSPRSPRSGRSPRRSPRVRTSWRRLDARRLCVGDPGLPVLVADQPVKAVGLEGEQVGNLQRFCDLGKGHPTGAICVVGSDVDESGTGVARGGQEWSFRGLADWVTVRMQELARATGDGGAGRQRKQAVYPWADCCPDRGAGENSRHAHQRCGSRHDQPGSASGTP